MKTLDRIDITDSESVRKYEDLLRKRLEGFGYRLHKGRTLKPGQTHIELKRRPIQRGFRITAVDSGNVIGGEYFDLSLKDVESLWLIEYLHRDAEKQWEKAALRANNYLNRR